MASPQPKAGASRAFQPHTMPTPVERAASEAVDRIGYVRDSHRAYQALEMLVTPWHLQDADAVECTRSDLGALLRVLNKTLRDELDRAEQAAQAVRSKVRQAQ